MNLLDLVGVAVPAGWTTASTPWRAAQHSGRVPGFLCEGYATTTAVDITAFGGWRAFLAAQ
jgi:hypothetical protein